MSCHTIPVCTGPPRALTNSTRAKPAKTSTRWF